MKKKYVLKVVSTFEFDTKEEAEAFADFRRDWDQEHPECVDIEIKKLYEEK